MKNILIIILVILIILVRSSYSACVDGHPSVIQEYNKSKLVFVGKVISEKYIEESEGYYDGVIYTVVNIENIKGVYDNTLNIFNENSSGRFNMKRGVNYILFVYDDGRLQIDNCGNSGILPLNDEVLNISRKLKGIEQGK